MIPPSYELVPYSTGSTCFFGSGSNEEHGNEQEPAVETLASRSDPSQMIHYRHVKSRSFLRLCPSAIGTPRVLIPIDIAAIGTGPPALY